MGGVERWCSVREIDVGSKDEISEAIGEDESSEAIIGAPEKRNEGE